MKSSNLFSFTFIIIIASYLAIFGQDKTIEMIKTEYMFILALIPLILVLIFFKFKLKDYELLDFNKNNTPTLKSTLGIFLIFQVIDYISEDGFIGMISQWFLYWVMGLIALLLLENINYYKNFKILNKNQ